MDDETLWVYNGKGRFIDGVPARDLTAADWARLNEDARVAVEQSALYRRAPKAESKEAGAKSATSARDKE